MKQKLTCSIDEAEFLQESNKIEGISDDVSFLNALTAWNYLKVKKQLSVYNVKFTHRLLMKNHLEPEVRGYFRAETVYIGGKEARPWYAIPYFMDNWVERANRSLTWEDIKTEHVKYEQIHPFIDGNGRSGRLLMQWQRLRIGLSILIIKESEKEAYYQWFK